MNYSQLQQLVDRRVEQAFKALDNYKHLDEGLEDIFTLFDAIMGKVKRGVRPADIAARLGQSKTGKGFHIATMFDHILMTKEAIRLSWENVQYPQGQHVACWEHVIPWKYTLTRIENYLLESDKVDEKVVLKILVEGSVKCFVSGNEDQYLRDAKLNSTMPKGEFVSWVFARYESVGIEPVILAHHAFNEGNMKTLLNKLRKFTEAATEAQYIEEITV